MKLLAVSLLALATLAPAATAQSALDVPCLTNRVPGIVSESRYFCEPLESTFFIQFDQFVQGLEWLNEQHPELMELKTIGSSVGELPILFVEVTNENSPVPRSEKLQLGYSASIHANEAAGREGMTRVIEDLVMGKGPYGKELQPLLDRIILNVWFPNPDSWASGDFFDAEGIAGLHSPADGTGFARENLNGVDLNRQFPNPGWILPEHKPMNEPESKAVVSELRYSGNHTNLVAGADLHGMLNSPNMVRSIIPNQDYDFRRMVLIVDQLRTTQERVEQDPAYFEWKTADELADTLSGGVPPLPIKPCIPNPVLGDICADSLDDVHDKPFLWGARWDQIGYTDSGFTSDYLTLSPRSPTGGMGAVGTIVEFAYSHMVPDNHYVAKLTDMHVAGVRQIVRTQMEMALRLDTPLLAGTGAVAFLDDGAFVSSDNDPNAYGADKPVFDVNDPATRFDFQQVPYKVSNQQFWRDLADYAVDPIVAVSAEQATTLDGAFKHLIITDQAIDALTEEQAIAIRKWVGHEGNHLILTDRALQFLDKAKITDAAVHGLCTYIGHSDLEDRSHPLLADVDWNARVTAEASATGFEASQGSDWNYPEWGVDLDSMTTIHADIVGTTQGHEPTSESCRNDTADRLVTMGRIPYQEGVIDIIGAALPMPTQAFDHRYGLADYSVSALTYWFFMNSLGGHIEWKPIETPFVPNYPYDPLYGAKANAVVEPTKGKDSPMPVAFALAALAVVAFAMRRRV